MNLSEFGESLKIIDLTFYREKYKHIKIVEMDLPKNIQAISLMYKIYWEDRKFVNYDDFYNIYLEKYSKEIEEFRVKTTMCSGCFYSGLPARIYRTWASIITQIHGGYVAESVFGKGSVQMSEELDHMGADFRILYRGANFNYQVKKETQSREVRKGKIGKVKLDGEFIDILYKVPNADIFKDPKTKKGEFRKPYLDFINNKDLERFENGFVVFTKNIFEKKKNEIDASL